MVEGASIGQYRVLRKIGEGGMGVVFLAEHALLGRRAAIKVLLPALSRRHDVIERFFNEARATASIPDPGIVQVLDFGFDVDGSAFIVMELLEGEPLDLRFRRLGLLAASDALRITRQVAGSLAAAHGLGIVHRDLKPDNLFMVRDPEAPGGERPKILDFGIAKLGGDQPGRMHTQTGALMGTPVYMSPEQCRGAGFVDHRSDIYSLGCVLFHLVTRRPPFDLEGAGELLSAHLREQPPAPSALVLGIPPGFDELVLRCLAKDPAQRFQSMSELQLACDRLLARITANGAAAPSAALASPGSSTPVPTTLGTASGQPIAAAPRRRAARWTGLTVAFLAAGIGLAIVTSRAGTEAGPPATARAATAPVVPAPPDAQVASAIDAAPPDAAPPDAAPADAAPPVTTVKPKRRPPRSTTTENLYDHR